MVREIEVLRCEEGVGAALVEEGAAAAGFDGEGIGVAGGSGVGAAEPCSVDPVGGAIVDDAVAGRIRADEPGCREWERGTHFGEVLEDIVWAAAIARRFAQDRREPLLARVVVDDLEVIDDEIPGCEQAGARVAGVHGPSVAIFAGRKPL